MPFRGAPNGHILQCPGRLGPRLLFMNVDSVRWLAEMPAPEQPKTGQTL